MQITVSKTKDPRNDKEYKPKKKRVTKQVRIKAQIHKRLRELAKSKKKTLSKFLDRHLENIKN